MSVAKAAGDAMQLVNSLEAHEGVSVALDE
jgi:hypothetical protein